MKCGSRQRIVGVLTVAACALTLTAGISRAQQTEKPQLAEEAFKNIKILKGIPVDEFMDTMGMFSAATNMNCTDCHADDSTGTWDKFATDTPITMTFRKASFASGHDLKDFASKLGIELATGDVEQ